MEKLKVNLYWDKWNFGVEEREGKSPTTSSQYIEYTNDPTDIGIYVDYDGGMDHHETIVKNTNHKYKVMVQMEPASFNRALHSWILENENLFDLIFVHYPSWKGSGKYPEKYRYYIAGSRTMIKPDDRHFNINNKNKNITTIWSHKNFGLRGHTMRHNLRDFISNNQPYKDMVDFNNPKEKIDVLRDYRFEIVIENEYPYFLTEKHIDAMLTGTIPIVWGDADSIQWRGFDTDGMIFFKDEAECIDILNSGILTEEYYKSKAESLSHNFDEVKKYLSFGDIIWNAGLNELQ